MIMWPSTAPPGFTAFSAKNEKKIMGIRKKAIFDFDRANYRHLW